MARWTSDEAASLLVGYDPLDAEWLADRDDDAAHILRAKIALERALEAAELPGTPERLSPVDVTDWSLDRPFFNSDLFWAVLGAKADHVELSDDERINQLARRNAELVARLGAAQSPMLEPPTTGPVALLTAPEQAPSGSPTEQSDLKETERLTFLKMILGMALDKYRFQKEGRSSSARNISDALRRSGISLSDDTIRSKLQEAADKIDVTAS